MEEPPPWMAIPILFEMMAADEMPLEIFPFEEIVVMMLALAAEPLTAAQISDRVFEASKSFASRVQSISINLRYWEDGPRRLQQCVFDILSKYDLPIEVDRNNDGTTKFTITLDAAMCVLRNHLSHAQHKPPNGQPAAFRFLDLPGEVRNVIYAMVLGFPATSINFRKTTTHGSWGTQKLRTSYAFELSDHESRTANDGKRSMFGYKTKPTNEVLAMFSVSKQVSKEALSIFYAENRFKVACIKELRRFLKMPQARLKWVRHISLQYSPHGILGIARASFVALEKLQNLHTVTMKINEDNWEGYAKKDGRTRTYAHARNFPGLLALSRMNNLKRLILNGRCDGVADFIKTTMKPKKRGFKLIVNGREVAMG